MTSAAEPQATPWQHVSTVLARHPAVRQAIWLLQVATSARADGTHDLAERVSVELLAGGEDAVRREFARHLARLRALTPTLVHTSPAAPNVTRVELTTTDERVWTLVVSVESDAPHRITLVLLQPTVPPVHLVDLDDLAGVLEHSYVAGASVAAVHDGKLEWARGFGVTATGGSTPVGSRTLLQCGSISKAVNALGALRLVSERVLDLDEDVNAYLTSWRLPDVGEWRPRVTVRHLLMHLGATTVHGFAGYHPDTPFPAVPAVLAGSEGANSAPVRVDGVPGLLWRYSGGGTTILQQAMTDVTGEPYDALMSRLVLEPLGMRDSTYTQPLPEQLRANMSAGHWADDRIDGDWRNHPEQAAAGLWTTATDLCLFGLGVAAAVRGEPNAIVEQKLAVEMVSPTAAGFMGLGLFNRRVGDELFFGHSGGNAGFVADLLMAADGSIGYSVLFNSVAGFPLAASIQHVIWRQAGRSEIPPSVGLQGAPPLPETVVADVTVADLEGEWLGVEDPGRFRLRAGGESLVLHATGQQPLPVLPEGNGTWRPQGMTWLLRLVEQDGERLLHIDAQTRHALFRRQ